MMREDLPQRIVRHLETRREPMRALLERMVRVESPSHDPEAQTPMFALLREALAERHHRCRFLRGTHSGGTLLSIPNVRLRGAPHQLVLGHADTVWPIGTLESMPIKAEGGVFSGPGAYDMKAGLVQGLFALEALDAAGAGMLPVTPVFLINSDEEVGSRDSVRVIQRLARCADRCFVLEPSLGPEGRLKTARKGVGRFVIRVHGKAAHAGLDPGKGASAILELSLVVQKLFALNDPERGITVNVGTIDGGLSPNVIAPESSAVVDVRVPTRDDAAAVEASIRSIRAQTPGTQVVVEGSIGRPPMEQTPRNQRLWRLAKRAANELGIPIEQAAAGGGSDGNHTSQLAPTLDGLGAVGAGAHARNEHVVLDRMVERAALLARLLSFPKLTEAA